MPYDGTEISQTNILINARNRLEKGWCQGHFELVSEDGNSVEYCIYGAAPFVRGNSLDAAPREHYVVA